MSQGGLDWPNLAARPFGITSNIAFPKMSSRSIKSPNSDSGVCEKNVHPPESARTFKPPFPQSQCWGDPANRVDRAAKKTSIFVLRALLTAWQH